MRILLVLAHPVPESFNAAVAAEIRKALEARGHRVDFLDLYREGFDPRLSEAERRAYMEPDYQPEAVSELVARLKAADGLILVFPQWWFNLPAILKGFIDRVFVPGVAFAPDPEGGRIRPGLDHLKLFWAVSTTGSPWWVVHLWMGNPVRRMLKRGVAAFCAKGARFRSFALHDMDRASEEKREAFLKKVRRAVATIS